MTSSIAIPLLCCAVQVTLVAVFALLLDHLLRRKSSSATCWIVTSGTAIIFLLTVVAFCPWPAWRLDALRAGSIEPPAALADNPSTVSAGTQRPPATSDTSDMGVSSARWTESAGEFWRVFLEQIEQPASHTTSSTTHLTWLTIVQAVLGIGILTGTARLAGGMWFVRRLRRRATAIDDVELLDLCSKLGREFALRADVALRETNQLSTAAVAGVWHPVILLPTTWRAWSPDQRRAVLAHELAHVANRDFLVNGCCQAVLTLHFYHPLVHLLVSRLRLAQELSADALAANIVGGRRAYLRSLAELALAQDRAPLRGPALAFLPNHRTFLRRIEMLRHRGLGSQRSSVPLRLVVVVLMFAVGLAAAGLRQAAVADDLLAQLTPPRQNATTGAMPQPTTTESPMQYVPAGATIVATVNVAKLSRQPAFEPALQALTQDLQPMLEMSWGVKIRQIDRVVVYLYASAERDPFQEGGVVLQLREDVEPTALKQAKQRTASNRVYYQLTDSSLPPYFHMPNPRTLVAAATEEEMRAILLSAALPSPNSGIADLYPSMVDEEVAVMVDVKSLRTAWREALAQAERRMGPMYGAVAPLVQNTHLAAFGINQSNQMNEMLALHLRAITAGGEQAEEVAATLRAAAVLAANALKQSESQLSSMRGEQRALAQIALATASATLKSLQVEVSEREVTATAQPHVGISSTAIALLVPAIESARIAAQRTQSMNNLRQIALAMHNYAATYGHFPPAVVMGGPNNDVPHSWRVAILPFLEEQALYNAYRKEEPWDSEHNKSLLSRMPEVYRSPSSQHDKFASSYYVFTGPATIFAGSQGTGLAEITDGTSATLLAVEAERDIPWTKPEDIPYDSNRPLPQLGGLSVENGILAARADGSVQVISQAIDEQILRRLIEKADGQSVGF